LVKRVNFKTFIIIFILAGSYLFIFSENGILERRELQKKYDQMTGKIASIKESNESIRNESEKYRSGKFSSKDIIDSGFVNKTGKILYTGEAIENKASNSEPVQEEFMISLEHLRYLWIFISIVLLFFFFFLNDNKELTDGSDTD
jgi:cell division protein FtsB